MNKKLYAGMVTMLLLMPSAFALLPGWEFAREGIPVVGLPLDKVHGTVYVAPTHMWRDTNSVDEVELPEAKYKHRVVLSKDNIMPGDAILEEVGLYQHRCIMPRNIHFHPIMMLDWCIGRDAPFYLSYYYSNPYFDKFAP